MVAPGDIDGIGESLISLIEAVKEHNMEELCINLSQVNLV